MKRGDVAALADVPAGAKVCNVEVRVGAGGSVARAAGCFCQVQAKLAEGVVLKLASGQRKLFDGRCLATVGAVSNRTHALAKLGKAGRARWLGRRPEVRGVAMNPVDHPHGGGEGKTSGGRQPVSPWG